ncbi:MAG: Gfo/Idh/MocA family oxidoreductase [Kiritimatiellae bacterium]|nr:Gfo/Idh/MocA family oxidoreductase [Kiritimatiellia bacterium]
MTDTFRIGVVGLGNWARRAYLPNIQLMDDVELAAVSTRSEANMAAALKELGCAPRTYNDYAAMLADGGLDGVIVATSAESHREVAAAALEAGCAVLCEKPLALSTEDCTALLELAEARQLALQVGLEFRHAPIFVRAVEAIAAGEIGQPVLTECSIFRNKRDSVLSHPERYLQNGGVFIEFLCHYLDIMTWLSGDSPLGVTCQAGRHLGTEVYDHGAIEVEYSDDMFGVLEYSLLVPAFCEQFEFCVLGDGGRMQIAPKLGEITFITNAGSRTDKMADPGHPSQPYPGSYEQIRAFIEAVRSDSLVRPDARTWLQVMAMGEAAARSVAEKTRVSLAGEDD